jgi:hypothetical protein
MRDMNGESVAVKYPMAENGLDYLWSAVEHLRGQPGRRGLKYAVLHLGAGAELVLKERLRRHDPKLLLRDPEQFDEADFEAGDFKSASVFATMTRLTDDAGVVLAEADRQTVLALREKRNRLEHFGIVDTREALVASTARTLDFLLEFIRRELGDDTLSKEAATYMEDIRDALPDLAGFVHERWERIRPEVDAATTAVVGCIRCAQPAAVLDDGSHCHFCADRTAAELAAEEYAHSIVGASHYEVVHDGGDWIVATCPQCERETHVNQGSGLPVDTTAEWVCFGCGETWSRNTIASCDKCGGPVDQTADTMGVCPSCWEATMARND